MQKQKAYELEATELLAGKEVTVRFGALPDATGWTRLQAEVGKMLENQYMIWKFDLRELTVCDSVGLGMWITLSATIRSREGRSEYLINPSSKVSQLFLLTKVDQILRVVSE